MIWRTMALIGARILTAAALMTLSGPSTAQNIPAPRDVSDPAVVREPLADLKFNIYRPRDLMQRRTPAPVIAWGNGGCMKFDFMSVALVERWAAAGYVVVTYNDPSAMPTGDQSAVRPSMAQLSAGVTAQTDAQVRMLDWAVEANARGGRFAGKLDTRRMILAGNSCGGITAVAASRRDRRARAIFIVSGGANMPTVSDEKRKADAASITLPTLYIVGGKEDIARAPVRVEYAAIQPRLPAVLIERATGDHVTVSNNPDIQLDEAAIGLNWFRAILYGDKAAARELADRGCTRCDPAVWSVNARNLPGVR